MWPDGADLGTMKETQTMVNGGLGKQKEMFFSVYKCSIQIEE